MLPAPCAALVVAFLGIEILPIFIYDRRAVGRTKFTAPIAVPGVAAPGAVLFMLAAL